MMLAVDTSTPEPFSLTMQLVASGLFFLMIFTSIYLGFRPLVATILNLEQQFDSILRRSLLLDIPGRMVTILTGVVMVLFGALGFAYTRNIAGVLVLGGLAAVIPYFLLRYLKRRRLQKLEDQLVPGIMTLASGVRAGLNLIQAMELIAREGSKQIRQEFAHLLREYEYGIPLEEAMNNAALRIGSGDYRLLFAALQTHRERGGDLGETLDRIAESIREIQRLEKRVQTLTAQGRTTARWLAAMPFFILVIYRFIDSSSVDSLVEQRAGNLVLLITLVLNVAGYLWIRKIVSIHV